VTWGCDELAFFEMIGGGKKGFAWVDELVWNRDSSFGHSEVLGEGVWGVFLENETEFSTFSWFSVKSVIVDGFSRAVVAVEGTTESGEVLDGVGEEKTGSFIEISLAEIVVERKFEFFPFSKSARVCDMATQARGPISRCLEVLVSVWVPVVDRETEGVARTECDDAGDC
jgi:hypothetical protein